MERQPAAKGKAGEPQGSAASWGTAKGTGGQQRVNTPAQTRSMSKLRHGFNVLSGTEAHTPQLKPCI